MKWICPSRWRPPPAPSRAWSWRYLEESAASPFRPLTLRRLWCGEWPYQPTRAAETCSRGSGQRPAATSPYSFPMSRRIRPAAFHLTSIERERLTHRAWRNARRRPGFCRLVDTSAAWPLSDRDPMPPNRPSSWKNLVCWWCCPSNCFNSIKLSHRPPRPAPRRKDSGSYFWTAPLHE